MKKLDLEEQEILEAFESGILTQVSNIESERKQHKKYATATFQKDSRSISASHLRIYGCFKSVL
ncbi:antitoxin [Crenothrix polyspora]|uniref:Uncharacterized protein n=1 Tax=Crenothrix polyspora TaxID=360316 RepID=A0A1R4HF42_9GAMM|nr:antitoxin [Crenothrix polyspora]SJM94829.1 conserved hypothetical protein [Crenothrix polyspora]